MALLPNAGPPLPTTHRPIPPSTMMELRDALVAKCDGGKVTEAIIHQVAEENGVPFCAAYAAISVDPNLVLAVKHDTLVAICVGPCQLQGAIPALEALLAERQRRIDTGDTSFDIIPRTCLDMCAHSPACLSRSADGQQKVHPQMRPEDVAELAKSICHTPQG